MMPFDLVFTPDTLVSSYELAPRSTFCNSTARLRVNFPCLLSESPSDAFPYDTTNTCFGGVAVAWQVAICDDTP
eukprot:COSAG02_NODE_31118_length_539_cov_0.629545_2_plen_73_part_01